MILIDNYNVKRISAKDTHAVRHPVLRSGKPISNCIFDGDDLKSTIHLGLFNETKLIGVSTFMKNTNTLFKNTLAQYQLRGMAILSDFQGKALGNHILSYGENLLKEQQTTLVWCNARKIATNFYKRNGYKIIDAPFKIPEIGIHYVMYKYL